MSRIGTTIGGWLTIRYLPSTTSPSLDSACRLSRVCAFARVFSARFPSFLVVLSCFSARFPCFFGAVSCRAFFAPFSPPAVPARVLRIEALAAPR